MAWYDIDDEVTYKISSSKRKYFIGSERSIQLFIQKQLLWKYLMPLECVNDE